MTARLLTELTGSTVLIICISAMRGSLHRTRLEIADHHCSAAEKDVFAGRCPRCRNVIHQSAILPHMWILTVKKD